MGGYFAAASKHDTVLEVFFGVDYHSHLGTRLAGMAAWDKEHGFQKAIHNIQNAPFRTKFTGICDELHGTSCIGCISDQDPQPLLVQSKLGTYAILAVGRINNAERLMQELMQHNGYHFSAINNNRVNGCELIAAIINQEGDFTQGIRSAQNRIDGTASILILRDDGSILAARDKNGRLPMSIGRNEDGYCIAFEPFAYQKLNYELVREMKAGEISSITAEETQILSEGQKKLKICAFLWTYYGYPTSSYEGVSVELMRLKSGAIMAEHDQEAKLDIDSVSGVPDSGTPYAIGYANQSRVPFARPFIKYTPTWPRSFIPENQEERRHIAKMKMIPVHELIQNKKLLLIDDSIVRGTQLRETVEFLYNHGAKEVHMRSACPPIMFSCKYLNFSPNPDDQGLLARKTIRELEGEEGDAHLADYSDPHSKRGTCLRQEITKKLGFSSLQFQTLDGLLRSIGIDPSDICTYCWNGKE